MGQEIEASKFIKGDFEAFEERLRAETDLLARWFAEDVFASTPKVCLLYTSDAADDRT